MNIQISLQLLKDDGLSTNICHRCLYNTELFSEFREGVHQCERKLQDFVLSLASRSVEVTHTEWHLDDILHDQHESNEFEQNKVVVIDPLKYYESSEEELNNDEEESVQIQPLTAFNQQAIPTPTPYNHMPIPGSNLGVFSPSSKPPKLLDAKPLRNICFCKYCEAAFAQRPDCDEHEKTKHDPIMPHVCNFCPFRCDIQANYISHIKQFHDNERPYFCTQCNKNFGRRADLRKHAVSHTGIRPFLCPICGKTFSRKTNVSNHMKVHDDKKHATPKDFGNKKSPAKLKNAFTPSNQANVGYRSDGFYPNQGYQIEQLSPSKSENVFYSKCAVKSEPNSIPKLKLKLTKPIAPVSPGFQCTLCEKTFKTKRDLGRHSQIHTGMKFQCSVCQIGFSRRDKLVRHEKTHKNRSKTAALPESAFLVENLKRGSHFSSEHKSSPATGPIEKQPFKPDFRPQFYAEYDLSETNN